MKEKQELDSFTISCASIDIEKQPYCLSIVTRHCLLSVS